MIAVLVDFKQDWSGRKSGGLFGFLVGRLHADGKKPNKSHSKHSKSQSNLYSFPYFVNCSFLGRFLFDQKPQIPSAPSYPISYLMEGKIKLGYWGLRGRGQVLRLLLAYTGLSWQEVTYKDASAWFGAGDKTKLGFDFPNLPYLINGDFKLTESIAIARYIIRKSEKKELLGKNAEDEARVDMVLSLLEDIYNPTFSLFFSPNHQNEKGRLYDNKIKAKLDELVHYIGNKDFTIGYLTLVDFKIAEATYYFEKLYPEHVAHFEALFRIRKHVEELPEVKSFYEKGGIKGPFLPTYAQLKF